MHTGSDVLLDHAVVVSGQRIAALLPAQQRPPGVRVLDGRGGILCPGLVDLQLYGGGGSAFGLAPSRAALLQLRRHTLRHGTTSFLPTVPTNTAAVVARALAVVRQALPTMPGLLGLHLEGPYLSLEKRGVHPADLVRSPTLAELTNLLQQGQGVLRLLTLAPEMLETAALAMLQKAAVVLSAGHSNASYEQASQAFA